MQTCKHCGGPLRPLFTSLFCPRECAEESSRSTLCVINGVTRRAQLIKHGGLIPAWAERFRFAVDGDLQQNLGRLEKGKKPFLFKISDSFEKWVNDDPDNETIIVFSQGLTDEKL